MKIQVHWWSRVSIIANNFFCAGQLLRIPIIFFCVLLAIVLVSLTLLYSAGHGLSPWCLKQFYHFIAGLFVMSVIATTPIRFWASFAYVFYAVALLGLALTAVLGSIGMGAQRWLTIASIRFQPSELMRIALVVALARRLSDVPSSSGGFGGVRGISTSCILVIIPVLITLKQPDLGTAVLLTAGSVATFFFAGLRWRVIFSTLFCLGAMAPVLWHFLRDYQKNRILTFLNPEKDPLGNGYHIIQSKIAIGSGGFWGKGFMHGTQGALDFLPEKHTDFIFTLLSEEFGFIGVVLLIALYSTLIFFNFSLTTLLKDDFAKLVIAGLTVSFSLYAIINISMVVGLLPVVGIPLPLVSYGGTSLITLLIGQGIILSAAFSLPKRHDISSFLRRS
ncbi:MAG: rod shape-determining protein RodA [Holosporales bacterium]|jgi:rod shape determining protein RodA|nr:rod shape-determining protein RodA [Holosporales bacterium]